MKKQADFYGYPSNLTNMNFIDPSGFVIILRLFIVHFSSMAEVQGWIESPISGALSKKPSYTLSFDKRSYPIGC